MKLTKFLLPLSYAFSLLFTTACTEKDNTQKVSCSTSQEDVLLASANQFNSDLANCYSAFSSLQSANWESITETELEQNKLTLKAARIAYNNVSAYNFGPAIVDGVELNDRFNIFPANEAAITSNALNAEQDIEALFKSQVGLEAIEYLVHNLDSISHNATEKNAVILHLKAQISAITSRMNDLHTAYSTGGYIEEFKNNTGSDDGSSLALFTNQFVQDLETRLRNNKLRIPIGKFNGGTPLLDKVEGRYSDFGLEFAAKHFDQLHRLYGSNSDSLSLASYLSCLGENDLSQSIETQFTTTAAGYAELQTNNGSSIKTAIENDNANLSNLIDEHQKLVALLKGPMLSALGVRINYTDSDGD
jgi:predicted lipoprotein